MEFLRNYTSVAHKEHFCNCCCRYIMPGEVYEGAVYATKNNGIIVSKQHISPSCDFPDSDEFNECSLDNNLESVIEKNFLSEMAA